MNTSKALLTVGINPFAVTLLAESLLKSPLAPMTVGKPQGFFFPINRGDCKGWSGVRITLEAVPTTSAAVAQAREAETAAADHFPDAREMVSAQPQADAVRDPSMCGLTECRGQPRCAKCKASGADGGPVVRADAVRFSIDQCEEAFVRDFCPYKGNPDPLVLWRAAWSAAIAATQARSPAAQPADIVIPPGWVPLTITHEPGYPEEVAFGPQCMMDRLKKWLDCYFAMRIAEKSQPAQPAQALPDGWSMRETATCFQLVCGAKVVANLVGPDAERNAAIIAATLATTQAKGLQDGAQDTQRLSGEADVLRGWIREALGPLEACEALDDFEDGGEQMGKLIEAGKALAGEPAAKG